MKVHYGESQHFCDDPLSRPLPEAGKKKGAAAEQTGAARGSARVTRKPMSFFGGKFPMGPGMSPQKLRNLTESNSQTPEVSHAQLVD